MKDESATSDSVLKVHVTTLGCAKNVYDSEVLMGQLKSGQVSFEDEPDEANIVIVNTCGFIDLAKQESVDAILEAEALKKEDPDKKVIVCGCLSARYRSELEAEMPGVDAFFGTEDYDNILDFLKIDKTRDHAFLYEQRTLSTPSHYAYLKISEGCNHTCAFCAIPLMRGKHRSRTTESLVAEAEGLAKQGVKELIVVSQDTTFYGLDLYGKQKIVALLKELEQIDGIEWIRLHYLYPTTVQDELIDHMGQSRKIVPYLDMPIQHISDSMLKIMKRGGNGKRIREIFNRARTKISDLTLRTTLIVGHPGETESDFDALKQFVSEFRFDRLGVFLYSHEENTPGFVLEDLPHELKTERHNILMDIQREISLESNLDKIGQQVSVIIDDVDLATMTARGRSGGDSPEIDNEIVIAPIKRAIKAGEIVDVVIEDASEYELNAHIKDTSI